MSRLELRRPTAWSLECPSQSPPGASADVTPPAPSESAALNC